jgi:phospholipid transport system transporter-binding protein
VDIEQLGDGRFLVHGKLEFETVTEALEESDRLFHGDGALDIDLGSVSTGDSAGLALLLEWVRQARHAGRKITFRNVPEQLLAIARISEAQNFLPMADGESQPAA